MQVSTLIGYGSPNKADTHDVHGAPLGAEEAEATRKNLGWPHGEFEVPQDVYDVFRQVQADWGFTQQSRDAGEKLVQLTNSSRARWKGAGLTLPASFSGRAGHPSSPGPLRERVVKRINSVSVSGRLMNVRGAE